MVDIPIAPQQFSLPGPARIEEQPNFFGGLNKGLEAGSEMAYKATQSAALREQTRIAKQKQALEEHQAKVKNAIDLNATIGERLKYIAPQDQTDAVKMGLKAIATVAPELGIDPTVVPDNYQELYDQFITAKRGHEETDPNKRLSDADYNEQVLRITKRLSLAQKEQLAASQAILPSQDRSAIGTTGGNVVTVKPATGEVNTTPLPGGSVPKPLTTGVSTEQVDIDLQKQLEAKVQPLHNAINAAYAVNQFGKLASKDTSGASDWALLQNASVALNPNSILAQQGADLNEQTAGQLVKTGGIPEQLTAYVNQKADGKILTKNQRDDIILTVNAVANVKRTQLMSAYAGFSQVSKAHGGNPAQVVTPIIEALPTHIGNNDDQNDSAGRKLAKKHMGLIPTGKK